MSFYKSNRWKRKRELILKRDNYRCKECSRYGKTTEAVTVHHIVPVRENESLRLDNNNLISLCNACHNRMHDRLTNELTNAGLDLQKRNLRKIENKN